MTEKGERKKKEAAAGREERRELGFGKGRGRLAL